MKNIIQYLLLFIAFYSASAQEIAPKEILRSENCGSEQLHNEMLLHDSKYRQKMEDFERNLIENQSSVNNKSAANYVIPVVVHVMHKGEDVGSVSNISDEAIYSKIRVLNEEYRKIAGSQGDGSGADFGIEFALAVRDPLGNCTNGIDRVNMSAYTDYMNYGIKRTGTVGMSDANLKAVSFWDSYKYYNIWLVTEIDNAGNGVGIVGYAYFASNHGSPVDGAVIISNAFRDTNSKTEVHELGHALNLYHTFEGDGTGLVCPAGNGCGSGVGDCCVDIPPHVRSTGCDTSGTNSCDNDSSNINFIKNYMDYSADYCKNMFTEDQKTRAVSAISTIRTSLLASSGNNKLVPPYAPIANFIQSSKVICNGEKVKFSDISSCIPNTFLNQNAWPGVSFLWTLTNGSTTLTSTLQNPEFTPTVQGSYNVTFKVTNSLGTNTKTVANALIVGNAPQFACTPSSNSQGYYGFSVNRVAFNTIDNSSWLLTNEEYVDYSCSKSTIVTAGQTYPLKVSIRAGDNYSESLEVYIDYNNNGIFETSEKIHQGSTASNTLSESTANITIPATAVKNVLLRMRVIGEAGTISTNERNCISSYYISDVEDYGVYITSTLGNQDFTQSKVSYYPNPVNDFLNITASEGIENIQIYNVLGQLILEQEITGQDIKIDFSVYKSGIYLVSVFNAGNKSTFKVLKN